MSSRRSTRTRQALVSAAREVFGETTFHQVKIADIAARAGVAHGSFYTYFASKHEVFVAVLDEVLGEGFTRTAMRDEVPIDATPAQRIEAANRRFFRFYADNARILASMEELAPTSPAVEERRHQSFMSYTYRSAAGVRRWRPERTLAGADPELTAFCLGSMVERAAQLLFFVGIGQPSEEELIQGLNRVWEAVLGLQPETTT